MCNKSYIIHLNRISGEKNYDEEGKEKKSVAQTLARLELGAVGL